MEHVVEQQEAIANDTTELAAVAGPSGHGADGASGAGAKEHFVWIDYLKALGIVAIVIGHARLPVAVVTWLHSFIIPLFFVVSGYLLKPGALAEPFARFFDRRVKRLIGAYFLFGAIAAAQAVVMSSFGAEKAGLLETLATRAGAVLYGSGSFPGGDPRLLDPVALWFFPALITSVCLTWGLLRLEPRVAALLFCGMALAAFVGRDLALPWEIEASLAAAPLLAFGHLLRQRNWLQPVFRLPVAVAPLLLVAGWVLAGWNAPMDFRLSRFGLTPLYYLAAALTLLGLLRLVARLPANPLVLRLSAATLFIFPTHQIFFWLVDTVARELAQLSEASMYGYAYTLTKSLITLAVLAGSYPWVRRWLPGL